MNTTLFNRSDTSTTVEMINPWEELETTTIDIYNNQGQMSTLDVNIDESISPPGGRGAFYYILITIYITVMSFSFVLNTYFIVILIYLRKALSDRPFFRIVWQLVIANILSVIANMGTSFPGIFILNSIEVLPFLKSKKYSFFAAIDETGDQIVLFCVLLIAVHRLMIFTISKRNEKFFCRYILNPLLLFIWIIAVGSSIVFFVFDCSFKFNVNDLKFEYWCGNTDYTTRKLYSTIGYVLQLQLLIFPILCLICYIIILVIVILQKNELLTSHSNRLEKEILIQALLVFVSFEVNSLALFLAMNIESQGIAFYIRKIVNSIEFLSGVLTPLFFLATNREIKETDYKLNPIRIISRKCYIHLRKRSSTATEDNRSVDARPATD